MASAGALKRGDARIFAQRFIIRGVRNGASGNQILQMLRSVQVGNTTLGYRTQDFYKDYNRYVNARKFVPLTGFKAIPRNFTLDFAIPIPTRGGNRFQYPFIVSAINKDTNETEIREFSIVSPIPIDELLLPEAVQNYAIEESSNVTIDWDTIEFQRPLEYSSELS